MHKYYVQGCGLRNPRLRLCVQVSFSIFIGFGSCPSFPKLKLAFFFFSEMPVILSLEDHCNRFPQKRPHTPKYIRKGSYRHYHYGRRRGYVAFGIFSFSFPSECHLYQKILGYEIHLATRMQQLKMATYFDEILGEMLLKVELSHLMYLHRIHCLFFKFLGYPYKSFCLDFTNF